MKKLELTMRVIEDRSAPLLLTEKNLPGACCCSCCCCFTIGGGNAGSVTLPELKDSTTVLPVTIVK